MSNGTTPIRDLVAAHRRELRNRPPPTEEELRRHRIEILFSQLIEDWLYAVYSRGNGDYLRDDYDPDIELAAFIETAEAVRAEVAPEEFLMRLAEAQIAGEKILEKGRRWSEEHLLVVEGEDGQVKRNPPPRAKVSYVPGQPLRLWSHPWHPFW